MPAVTTAAETLGQPLRLKCGVELRNRIAKAATSENLADRGGAPGERILRLYDRWGRGGAGLIITGNVAIDVNGLELPGNVVLEDERHLDALRRWAANAQAKGARLFMQINH